MNKISIGSLAWSPTIAMSWLWGIGFFYSIHITLVHGWVAFCCFAAINATGLFLFGVVLDRRPESPEALVAALGPRFALVLLLVQVAALATCVFGFVAYLAEPLAGPGKGAALAVLVLLASAIGHALPIAGLRRLHAVLLVAGAGAGLTALWSFPAMPGAGRVPALVLDERFLGLALPSLFGFLLGPWLDLQQWRRAAAIRAEGGSLTWAYGGGALLFAASLGLNALIAAAAGPAHVLPSADGLPDGGGAVARGLAAGGLLLPAVAFAAWTGIAMATTIDSAYEALSWFLRAALGRSTSAVLALVPARLLSSPLPALLAGTTLGWAAASTGLSLIYLMAPFATVFIGSGACLVCAVLGARAAHDTVLNLLLGTAAALVFLLGYVAPLPLLIAGAPLIGLIGVLPAFGELTGLSRPPPAPERPASDTVTPAGSASPVTIPQPGEGGGAGFWFEGDWFVMPVVPSYDDTNSVGNVYFANYVRWVGKARELFFNRCMPDFELKTTDFFILTRSFSHDFRREAREFDPLLVRIKIAHNNRKFVTLAHEIANRDHGLLGSGEQTLMFVDSRTSQMLDVPSSIIRGFLPHWPKGSRFAKHSVPAGQMEADTAGTAVPRSRAG